MGCGEKRAPVIAKINGVENILALLLALLPEGMLKRAPLHLQPDAPVERVEVPVLRIFPLQTDLRLHAVKALVHYQAEA